MGLVVGDKCGRRLWWTYRGDGDGLYASYGGGRYEGSFSLSSFYV